MSEGEGRFVIVQNEGRYNKDDNIHKSKTL